jgi:hypothetical protein
MAADGPLKLESSQPSEHFGDRKLQLLGYLGSAQSKNV